jgi:hypothetical protein
MKRILIAIPTAKYIEPETMKSIYNLKFPEGYEAQFEYFYGYQIDQIRNLIANWMVEGPFDYLFAVDSDITFPPDTLEKMLKRDVDMITGVYRQRLPEQHVELYDMNYQRINYDSVAHAGCFQIGGCGMGCVLIKKQVFLSVKYPHFEYHQAILMEDTVSEDVDFCQKVNNAGHNIYVDTSIRCEHLGSTVYKLKVPPAPVVEQLPEKEFIRSIYDKDLLPASHVNYLYKIKDSGVKPKVIYDIGACVLHWTRHARNIWPDSEVICFEAMSECKFLYDENNLRYYIGVFGDEDGKEVKYYKDIYNLGGNSIYKERGDAYNEDMIEMRKMKTLDTITMHENMHTKRRQYMFETCNRCYTRTSVRRI